MGFSKSVNYLIMLPIVSPTVRLHPLSVTLFHRSSDNFLIKMFKILSRCFGCNHEEFEEESSQASVHLFAEPCMRHSVDIDAEPALGQQPPPHSESFGTSYGDFELMLLSDYNNNTLQRVGSVTSLTAHRGSPLTLSDLENSHDSQDFWSFEDVEDVMGDEDEDRDRDMAAASEVPEVSSAVSVSDGDDNDGDVAAAFDDDKDRGMAVASEAPDVGPADSVTDVEDEDGGVAEVAEAPDVSPAWHLKLGVIVVVDETHEDVFPEDNAEELVGVNGLVSQGGFPEESE